MRARELIWAGFVVSASVGCGSTGSTDSGASYGPPTGAAGSGSGTAGSGTAGAGNPSNGGAGALGSGGSAPDADAGGNGEAGEPGVTPEDPSAIQGKLLSRLGDPVAGALLRVGGQELVTDSNGGFSATGVADHYDLVVTDGTTRVHAYLGLTTRTPIVKGWDSPIARTTTLEGTFSGGFGTPWSPSTLTGLWRQGAVLEFLGPPAELTAPSSYGPVAIQWWSDINPIDVKLLTVQFQTSGGSVSGWAAALADLTMTEGENVTQDVALSMLSTHTVTCSVNQPSGVTLTGISPYVMGFGAENASVAAPLEVVVPLGLSEFGVGVTAQGSYGDGVSFTTVLVPDEQSEASLALTVPPSIVAPAADATGVDATTSFEWSDYAEGVQQLRILANVGGLEIEVFTDGTSFQLSDLSLSDFGYQSGAKYGWYTFGIGPVTSVDELVSGANVLDAKGASYHAVYPARYFTAQ